jgi:hypothetical protein
MRCWLLLLLILNGCCCGKSLENESYVKVPLTLDEVKKLEKDGATVSVERKTRASGGGGACGHSPICIIFLPVLLYEAAFPEKWDEVVVKSKDGTVTLVGYYETGGALIHAQHLVDGEMRETRTIELKELGKKVYVDSARLVPESDGGVRREVLSLSSQHDFIGDVRMLLASVMEPERRAKIINEARVQLEDEGMKFALERMGAADEPDEAKAEVVHLGCETPGFEPLLEAAKRSSGPWTKLRLVKCLRGEEQHAMLLEVEQVACDPNTSKKLMDAIGPALTRDLPVSSLRGLQEAHAKCMDGPHRALVGLWLNLPVQAGELNALLNSELEMSTHRYLHASDPIQRAAMVKEVASSINEAVLLDMLIAEKSVLEPAELEQLANWFIKPRSFFTTSPRAKALKVFSFSAMAPDGVARTKLARAALAKAKPDPMFDSAIVALGDRSRMPAAVKGIKSPVFFGTPASESDLVAYGLKLAGCSQEELVAVADKKKAMPDCGAPGSVEVP